MNIVAMTKQLSTFFCVAMSKIPRPFITKESTEQKPYRIKYNRDFAKEFRGCNIGYRAVFRFFKKNRNYIKDLGLYRLYRADPHSIQKGGGKCNLKL